ncbi:hypothetical protein ACLKA7_006057 [Drosophila subpalustris]
MSISVDYKWRTRMCRKWQEEMQQKQQQHLQQQQQQQQPKKPQQQPQPQQQQQQLGNRRFNSFVEDPMNMHKLFLSRRTLQLLSHRPDFQRLVKSCFVRVKFGEGEGEGEGHRVAQIQGFGKWRPNNDPTLILRLDNNPRVFAMDQLANNYFERAELRDFEYMWQAYNFELPSKRFVDQKHKAITEAKLQSQAQLMGSVRYPPRPPILHKCTKTRSYQLQDYRSMPYVYSNSVSYRKVASNSNSSSASVSVSLSIPNVASTASSSSSFVKPSVPSTLQTRKYLVEPMDCYKPYLPKQLPSTATVTSSKLMEPPKHPISSLKKKISLDEYRERFIKKQN